MAYTLSNGEVTLRFEESERDNYIVTADGFDAAVNLTSGQSWFLLKILQGKPISQEGSKSGLSNLSVEINKKMKQAFGIPKLIPRKERGQLHRFADGFTIVKDNENEKTVSSHIQLYPQSLQVNENPPVNILDEYCLAEDNENREAVKLENHKNNQEMLNALFLKSDIPCLLYGSGGIGKTTLMKRLFLLAIENRMCPVAVSLAQLLDYSEKHPIAKNILAANICSGGGAQSSYLGQFLHQHNENFQNFAQESLLFLFDGFNEMIDALTNKNCMLLSRIVQEIKDLCADKYYHVIISTREVHNPEAYFSKDFSFRKIKLGLIKGEMQLRFEEAISNEAKREIEDMLRRPLFYNLYQQMAEKPLPGTKYEIMKQFYFGLFEQSVGQAIGDIAPKSCLYFFVLPRIAHKLLAERRNDLPKQSACDFINQFNRENANLDSILDMTNNCLREMDTLALLEEAYGFRVADSVLRMAEETNLFVKEDRGAEIYYRFSHQEWLEFLGAFYVLNCLKLDCIATESETVLMPTFNLNDRVREYICQQYDLHPTIKDDHALSRKFAEQFAVREIAEDLPYNEQRLQISRIVYHLFLCFEFYDHCGLHLYEGMFAITNPVYEYMRTLAEQNNLRQLMDMNTRVHYIKSLCALVECFRRKLDYENALAVCDFAEQALGLSDFQNALYDEEMLTYRMMRHQRGKAMLFYAQAAYQEDKPADAAENLAAKQRFDDAMKILESNRKYNLSANLLGCMYATPISFLLEKQWIKRDTVKAFCIYKSAVDAMQNSAYKMSGTELIYTGQQMVALLLKGYVILDANNEPRENTAFELPNIATLDLAKTVFSYMEGHNPVCLNCLRALEILYRAEYYDVNQKPQMRKAAIQLLQKEEESKLPLVSLIYLSNIIPFSILSDSLLQELHIDKLYNHEKFTPAGESKRNALIERIVKQKQAIGKQNTFDQTDAYYYLQDLRQFGNIVCNINFRDSHIKTEFITELLALLPTQFPVN